MFSLMMAWYLNMICCLARMDDCDQLLKASLAASTAACISPSVHLGTRVTTWMGMDGKFITDIELTNTTIKEK